MIRRRTRSFLIEAGTSPDNDLFRESEERKEDLVTKVSKKIWKKKDLDDQMEKRLQCDADKIMGTTAGTNRLTVEHSIDL